MNISLFGDGFLAQACSLPIFKHCFANNFTLRLAHWGYGNKKLGESPHTLRVGTFSFSLAFHLLCCKTVALDLEFMGILKAKNLTQSAREVTVATFRQTPLPPSGCRFPAAAAHQKIFQIV
jgi:hypothetical protein